MYSIRTNVLSPVLIKDAVYQVVEDTTVTLSTRGSSDQVVLRRGEFIVYRGTTGMKADDKVIGFQFYHVDGAQFVNVPTELLAQILTGHEE